MRCQFRLMRPGPVRCFSALLVFAIAVSAWITVGGGSTSAAGSYRLVVPMIARGPSPIDYSAPAAYLEAGEQSSLTPANLAIVQSGVGPGKSGIELVGAAENWIRDAFTVVPNGGATIGITDVNDLVDSRILTGCHDTALLSVSILRTYGIPAIMVDTAGIQWAEDFRAGRTQAMMGHVFVEASIGGRWILVECGSGSYVATYNPGNPAITTPYLPDATGYYVVAKGIDPAGYGVRSSNDLAELLRQFANALHVTPISLPGYEWQPLPMP